jgi:hypothetical protein
MEHFWQMAKRNSMKDECHSPQNQLIRASKEKAMTAGLAVPTFTKQNVKVDQPPARTSIIGNR